MEKVLIDPEMFMLPKGDIEDNIEFFEKIIALNKAGTLTIGLYREVIDKLLARQIYPFPVNIQEIEDKALKEKLLVLNNTFALTIMNNFEKVDIDSCSGSQEFMTDRRDLENSVDYFAFFSMLLSNCYCKNQISDKVLVGKKKTGICEGETINISCNCEMSFAKTYYWISPDSILNDKQRAEQEIRKIIHNSECLYVESPEVKRSEHHNKIQNEDFDHYEELKAKNKKVLNYLRYFGLQRVFFERYSPDESREIGSIKLVRIGEFDDFDIIEGWLYGCIGFKVYVKMYFPKLVGKLLYTYFEDEITRKKIDDLKSSLAI